jgi:peptide/nickel transport system permease protein
MTVPARLRTGLIGVAVLAVACVVGPLVLPTLPAPDPVRAALQPPLTRITAVTLTDGSSVSSSHVSAEGDSIVVGTGDRQRVLPRDRVTAIEDYHFWLGSDRFGRDVLRRLLVGGRVSLAISAFGVLVALILGSAVGIGAATAGGIVDGALMRTVDALLAFPVLFLMILAATLFRPGPVFLVILLGVTSWMGLARLVRGQVLSLRTRPFILAARASGSRGHRIAIIHYLPNLVGPLAQDTALRMGDLVIAEATLSYLGLGVPPSIPTWGSMVAEGHRVMLDGWWLAVLPGVAIAGLVICLALIGDGLQQLGDASS